MADKPTYEDLEQRVKELEKDAIGHKRPDEALRKSEEKYRLLAENASDVIWTRDMNLNPTYLSPSIEKLTGYSVEESIALPNSERMTPASMELMMKIFEEELKLEAQGDANPSRVRTIEIEMICKDGSTVWVEVSVKFIRNETGQAVGILGISRDVNERKQVEEALRESEEKYRTIFNNAQVGLYRSRFKDGKMLIVNDRMAEIFGYESQEEAVADYVASEHYIDSGARERLLAIMREHGKFTNFETQMTRRDNSVVWVQYSGTLYPEKGYFEGVAIDITNRKQTEETLRESEKKYRTLLETTSEGWWMINTEHKTIEVNQALCNMLGYSQDEMIGKTPFDFVDDENRKIFIEQTSKIYSTEHCSYAITLKKKNGQDLHTYFNATTIRDESGEVQGSFAFVTNITEQKSLEAQLQQAQKMEAIGALAGGIAHDFNNILYSIIGYTDLTMDDVPEGSLAQSNLKEVLIAANRAKDMVQQILAFSRQTKIEKKPVKIQSAVKEAIKLLKTSIPTIIEIRQNIDKDCKPVMADPTQIHQVVMNLATNAYHAMREKGGVLTINVAKKKISMDDSAYYTGLHPGTYVKLTVSDTGHGIDKAVTEKIFDPYFTTKPVGEGTGMGLSTIHGIVKSHGGDIKVYSEPGKGTVFHVYFPLIETKHVEPEIISRVPVQKGSERILLVDDQEQIVSMVKQTLERLGYQVATRTSSPDTLEAFRAKPDEYDLVITDMTMQNMTGVELATRLLEIRPDIPIIICTGFSEKISVDKAKAVGIRGFVMKPVVRSELAKKIREVLD